MAVDMSVEKMQHTDEERKISEEDFENGPDARLLSENRDLESQIEPPKATKTANATEYSVPLRTKLTSLAIWFLLNLSLTLQSKMILGKFAFPWLLTAFHTGTTALGCYSLVLSGYLKTTRLGTRENLILVGFSFLFTMNIAISNVSLSMVSVAFHQMFRSTVPVFTIFIYRLYFSRSYSTSTYLSLIPIVLGVAMVTYGDYYFTIAGFSLTLLGVILAALKGIISNRLMTGSLALPALEILLRMAPLAAIQSLFYAGVTGELRHFMKFVEEGQLTNFRALALLSNSLIAFLLNISSFHTNKIAGALTITVCGNLKQVLTVLLGIVLFDVKVGAWNGVGMLITFVGAACYSKVELNRKMEKSVAEKPKDVPLMSPVR